MKPNDRRPRLARALMACVALGAFGVSCGDDDDSASTAATSPTAGSSAAGSSSEASGDVCEDREALRASVDALTGLDVVAEGTNGVTAAVSAVKDDLAALRGSGGAELQPQVQAVEDAVAELETAVANVDSGGAAAAVTAATSLASSARALLGSLDAGACGASATSTT